MELLLFSSLF